MKRTQALESHMYGDPMQVLERKQASEAKEKQHGKRRILTAKPNWSAARQRAEQLFAPEPVLASTPGTHRNDGRPDSGEDS